MKDGRRVDMAASLAGLEKFTRCNGFVICLGAPVLSSCVSFVSRPACLTNLRMGRQRLIVNGGEWWWNDVAVTIPPPGQEKYGWAVALQDTCSTRSGPGPRYRSRCQVRSGGECGRRRGVRRGRACDRFAWVRRKKELREEKKTRRHGFGAMTWCGKWAQ